MPIPIPIALTEPAAWLFDTLERASSTPESRVLYILAVLCVLMVVDFLTGSLAAWRAPDVQFSSQQGINGILRKLASILVLCCCIPIAPLVPAKAGTWALIVLYLGYLVMEFRSILENLAKLGVPLGPLKRFAEYLHDRADDG